MVPPCYIMRDGQYPAMRILTYIHTFNDAEVIDRALQAILGQTYTVPEILLVDNGSTDRTLDRSFPEQVTIIRHRTNLGTSGAVATGLQYALAKQYDWIWVLDADSQPRQDALEKLVDLYTSSDPETKSTIGVLSCSQLLAPSPTLYRGRRLTPGGMRRPKIDGSQQYCECDSTIWSGSLFNLQAVRAVGLPRYGVDYWEDLSLDYGDVEYIYRIKRAGYYVFVHLWSIIDHPVGTAVQASLCGLQCVSTNHSPGRRYLFCRNMVYFWLYIHSDRQLVSVCLYMAARLLINMLKISIMEDTPLKKIEACLCGVWDGLRKRIHQRF